MWNKCSLGDSTALLWLPRQKNEPSQDVDLCARNGSQASHLQGRTITARHPSNAKTDAGMKENKKMKWTELICIASERTLKKRLQFLLLICRNVVAYNIIYISQHVNQIYIYKVSKTSFQSKEITHSICLSVQEMKRNENNSKSADLQSIKVMAAQWSSTDCLTIFVPAGLMMPDTSPSADAQPAGQAESRAMPKN